jgi:hypothetical protein
MGTNQPPPPPRRSWKHAALPSTPPSSGQHAWQHSGGQPAVPSGKRLSRKTLVALLGGGIFVLAAVFLVVIFWPRPAPPVCLVLVGAGYEHNLAVPHNVAGRRTLHDLAQWGKTQARVEVHEEPLNPEANPVAKALDGCKSEVVVVFLAAHGGADHDGPYLINHDADFHDSASRYRLSDALEALRGLPKTTKKKVLLVDATQVGAHWPSGQLQNDFAHALKQSPEIDKDPNLVVICSSQPDQRSWVDEEWGRTVFAHFVLEGLQGAADGELGNSDGRVDALELFEYVRRKVERWARDNRAATQTPFLLGDKNVARDCTLASGIETRDEDRVPNPTEDNRFKEVESVWKQAADLAEDVPAPAVYTPHLWRKYLDTALRYEQLVRAGDLVSAEKLRLDRINVLAGKIRNERALQPGAVLPLSLPMPAAFGVFPTDREQKALQQFEVSSDRDFRDQLTDLERAAEVSWHKPLLRLRAAGAVLRNVEKAGMRSAAAEEKQLTEAGRALAILDGGDPSAARPAEAHFLAMLHPSAARNDAKTTKPRVESLLEKGKADLLRTALRVRRLAEEAALGLGIEKDEAERRSLPAYSEQVFSHIQETIEKADAARRKGEDLLFTDDAAQWAKVGPYLGAAEEGYLAAQQEAIERRRALKVRHALLAELPYYTRFCARWRDPDTDTVTELCQEAWKQAHELGGKLDASGKPVELEKTRGAAEKGLEKVRRAFQDAVKKFRPADTQPSWRAIEAFLEVPFIEPSARLNLLRESQRISYKLNTAREKFDGPPLEDAQQARRDAQREGNLALAFLGQEWERTHPDTVRDIQSPDLREWSGALRRAGEKIGEALQQFPETSQTETEKALALGLGDDKSRSEAAGRLGHAARLARLVEGAAVDERLSANPVGEERRLLLHNLLCWQAERTRLDFWAALSPSADTPHYYQAAGLAFLREAEVLLDKLSVSLKTEVQTRRKAHVNQLRDRLNTALLPVMRWEGAGQARPREIDLHLTDEKQILRRYEFQAPDGMPAGTPVLWVSSEGEGFEADPGQARRLPRDGFNKFHDLAMRTQTSDSTSALFKVHGLYRGHESVALAHVHFHRHADLAIHQPPGPPRGRVAVQSDVGGTSRTALALVLDCSGSMTFKVGNTGKSRFEIIKESLREVMGKLPPGVIVSFRVFGGLGDGNKADTVQLWPPRPWKGKESLEELDRELERQERQLAGGTPLTQAVLEAVRKDFPTRDPDSPDRPFKGLRTMVVVTDGVEDELGRGTNLENQPVARGKAIYKALVEGIPGGGVALNVIGFEVGTLDKVKEQPLQEGFEKAIVKLGGTYSYAGATDLALKLQSATGTVRYQVEPEDWDGQLELRSQDISRYSAGYVENPRWADELTARNYILKVRAGRALNQKVRVLPGDSLLLDLVADNGRLAFRRCLYAESMLVRRNRQLPLEHPVRVTGGDRKDWVVGVLQNEPRSGGLQLMTTLEKDEGFAGSEQVRLQQFRPRLTWFEITGPGDKPAPRLHVTTLHNYPAPAWGLDLPVWGRDKEPTLRAWWWSELETPPIAGSVSKEHRDFKDLKDLAGKEVRLESDPTAKLTILNVTHEIRKVEVGVDTPLPGRNCLVVRLLYPKEGEPFFVLPPSSTVGAWHRFYRDAGVYVGVFWNFTEEEAQDLKALQFISVQELKDRGLKLKKPLPLGTPGELYRRPLPN